jgi:poly-gamma-glutamate synthesis protein (capsule biosynthesis protein)
VDAVVLANNHIADKGYGGVKATTDALYEAGVRYTGAFANEAAHDKMHPLIFDKNGFRIALLNYTYGLNGMPEPRGAVVNRIDTLSVKRDIESARHKGVDYVIVFFHWGEEYSSTPNSVQRSLARISRSAGADFVIGSHPHVVQPLEIERDSAGNVIGAVAYSLGNLVSNQRERRTDGGMLLGIDIAERDSVRTISVSHIPTWVYMPNIHGRKRYLILPRPVADTMLSRDPAAHTAYKIFLEDSRRVVTGE